MSDELVERLREDSRLKRALYDRLADKSLAGQATTLLQSETYAEAAERIEADADMIDKLCDRESELDDRIEALEAERDVIWNDWRDVRAASALLRTERDTLAEALERLLRHSAARPVESDIIADRQHARAVLDQLQGGQNDE